MRDFALEVYFSKWEFAAKYNMTASDCESMTLAQLLALAQPQDRAQFEGLHLGYTETYGAPQLREEIARTYDSIDPAHLLCFAGAEEGIYAAMRVLLEPADHVIVITPNYQASTTCRSATPHPPKCSLASPSRPATPSSPGTAKSSMTISFC